MKHLYAPWRGIFSQKNDKLERNTTTKKSPFAEQFASDDDEKNFILKRLSRCGIVLNHYPYNPGHLLIIPYAVVPSLDQLEQPARLEMMEAMNQSIIILETYLQNPGTNVGINIGDASSGGSIPGHLHVHVVPRWHGDTNFLPILAETKQLSKDLRVIYDALKEPFNSLEISTP